MGCYAEEVLGEISEELLAAIEGEDDRPQCCAPDGQSFACHSVRDGLAVTTLTRCEDAVLDSILAESYAPMRALFRILAADGTERLLKHVLTIKEKRCYSVTLDYLTAKTATDEATAKDFLAFLASLNRTSSELVLDKRSALLGGAETDVYDFYPGHVTRLLRAVLLTSHLLMEEKGGFR